MNISTVGPLKVNPFHHTFPSRTLVPNIGPHHFICEKVGPTKVDKVGPDWLIVRLMHNMW